MPEALQKIAEWFFDEKMPGFQWVIFALLMLEFALGVEGLRGAGVAIGLAILLSWVGSKSDFFFDGLYGPDSTFTIKSLGQVPRGSYLVVDVDFRGDGTFVKDKRFSLPDWWRQIKGPTTDSGASCRYGWSVSPSCEWSRSLDGGDPGRSQVGSGDYEGAEARKVAYAASSVETS
jgi:hypothetical protein